MKSSLKKAQQTTEVLPGLHVHTLKTSLPALVTLEMSFQIPGGTHEREKKVAELTAALLDAGTKKHSKDALRTLLEGYGAQVAFSQGGAWLTIDLQCLSEDVSAVLGLVAEMLSVPSLIDREADILKKRWHAELEDTKSSTGSRANRELRAALFPESHEYYAPSIEEEQRILRAVTIADVRMHHRQWYGRGKGHVVAVGDVRHEHIAQAIKKHFAALPVPKSAAPRNFLNKKQTAQRTIITLKDQASVDVRMGHTLSITRKDPQYFPLVVLLHMLGGGFSAHLMQTVRERDGLTYGIYASLQGFTNGSNGWWQIGATFSPQLFLQGEASLGKELKVFLESGITEESVARGKEDLLGSHTIGLATSRGLARTTLHGLLEWGSRDFAHDFIERIAAVTIDDVRSVRSLLNPSVAAFVAVGSIDKNGNPL